MGKVDTRTSGGGDAKDKFYAIRLTCDRFICCRSMIAFAGVIVVAGNVRMSIAATMLNSGQPCGVRQH